MISRSFASVFPRQSPSSSIFSSINAEADSTGTGLFIYSSSRTYFSCAQRNLQPPQLEFGKRTITLMKTIRKKARMKRQYNAIVESLNRYSKLLGTEQYP